MTDRIFPLTWVDGVLHEGGDPVGVSASDGGLIVGDGVFETIRILDGRPFEADAHLDRLERSAVGLGIVAPDRTVTLAAVLELAKASELPDGRLRVTVTGGSGPLSSVRGAGPAVLLVAAEPSTPAAAAETVLTCPWTLNERGPLTGLKTTSYAGNVRTLAWAKARGAGEALFLNTVGQVSEGTGSNLFAVIDGTLVTPPLESSGCLAGITRAVAISLADRVDERPLYPADLAAASEIFLTSTTRDVQPVGWLDGRQVSPQPGPVTVALRDRFLRYQRHALGDHPSPGAP